MWMQRHHNVIYYIIKLARLYRCGQLTRMWSMRYESKHSMLKIYVQVVHQFKNIPKSIAYHHQHQMCCQMADDKSYLVSKEICGPGNM